MGWIHTGGGWYENEETGGRIRGKANLLVESSEESKDYVPGNYLKHLFCSECLIVAEHLIKVRANRPPYRICQKCDTQTED